MITPKNVFRHELIGLKARVAESSNKANAGLEGRVVDETRNTLALEVRGKEKTLAKEQCVFVFSLPSGEKVRVEGKALVGRPEDRIKKRLKKW